MDCFVDCTLCDDEGSAIAFNPLLIDSRLKTNADLPVVPIGRGTLACGDGQITGSLPPVPRSLQRGASRSSRTWGAGCDGRFAVRKTNAPCERTMKSRGP